MNALFSRHLVYTQLAQLLGAGIPIRQAAESLLRRQGTVREKPLLEAIHTGLARGETIAGSLAGRVAEVDHTVIEACERGGRLEEAFEHLGGYYGVLDETRKRVLGQLIYPVLLLHLVPLPTAAGKIFTEGVGAFVIAYVQPLAVLYVGAAIAWLAARAVLKRAETDPVVDRTLAKIPVLGRLRRGMVLARFAKVLSITLLAGRRVSDSLQSAVDASRSGEIRADCRTWVAGTEAGSALGPLLDAGRSLPVEMSHGLATAEIAGTLEVEASRWADYWQADVRLAAQRFAEWLPRFIYAAVVVVVAWRVLSFWIGYFGQVNSLLQGM